MRRRRYVCAIGAGAVAALPGCSVLSGPASSTEYGEDVPEDDLIPPDRAFPDDWQRQSDTGEGVDTAYLGPEERLAVLLSVSKFDTDSAAADEFEAAREEFVDTESLSVADDAFWTIQDRQTALAVVRDGNAIGRVRGSEETGPDASPAVTTAVSAAESLAAYWQSLGTTPGQG